MSYTDPSEAIVGVLQASGVAEIDWTKSPYQIEAAEPLPEAPFPFVVFMLPKSSVQHMQGVNAYVETFEPTFWVVGLESQRSTILSPYVQGGVVYFLDSLRGTLELVAGYQQFSGDGFQCTQFTRNGYKLSFDQDRAPNGERVLVVEADYKMIFNQG